MAKKIFDSVRESAPNLSAFDLSHEQKLTANFGKLYPTLLQEVLPADQFSVRTETLVRMQPMLAPIMERIDLYMHYFFVPNRLVWDEWEPFITGGDKGEDAPNFPVFVPNETSNYKRGLTDYFGIPPTPDGSADNPSLSQLPFRAYHLIWNEYYRDQNLQEEFDITAAQTPEFYAVRTRSWAKDYFTSALPYPQKGPAVPLPIEATFSPQYKDISLIHTPQGAPPPSETDLTVETATGNMQAVGTSSTVDVTVKNLEDVQLIDQTSVTIEELRRSARLQEWLEKAARGGTRLVEMIRSYFGVFSGDARLDRPEYLGGGRTPITVSEVLNTTGINDPSAPNEPLPQGNMSGHGIAVGANNSFSYKVKEHGYIIGIMSIMPKSTYSQGIARHWSRRDKFDFYWPQFANIGEQAVTNKELYFDFNSIDETNDETFGYQQRYAEYKYSQNTVHADFRDNLSFWTLARNFADLPNLNEDFIQCDDPNLNDIFTVVDPEEDKFLVQMYHSVKARRPMPYFSRPEL